MAKKKAFTFGKRFFSGNWPAAGKTRMPFA
jgi:hypothetical protein